MADVILEILGALVTAPTAGHAERARGKRLAKGAVCTMCFTRGG